jgi:hypothetical protein
MIMNSGAQEKVYCYVCDDEFPVVIREEQQNNKIRGKIVSTLVTNAYCMNCGGEVYVPQINDANIKKIEQTYRKENGIITVQEVEVLLKSYNIGAKPLSLLLNWGECTIPRYLKGQLPNNEHSEKLKSIKNPYIFWDVFNQNRHVLSGVAARKVETALSAFVEMPASKENIIPERSLIDFFRSRPSIFNGYTQFNLKKTVNVILFFLCNYGAIYKTKINKLLWYSDMVCYKRNSKAITGLMYIRNYYGPVPARYDFLYGSLSDVYIELVESGLGTQLVALKDLDKDCFSQNELTALEDVGERFKSYYSSTISDFSHDELAWTKTNLKELISFDYAKDLNIN